MLTIDADTKVTSTARGTLRNSETSVEVVDGTPDGPDTASSGGAQLVVGAHPDTRSIEFLMYTNISNITGRPTLVMAFWALYQYYEIGGVDWDPVAMRWWRIREQGGWVAWEVSRDTTRWHTVRDVKHGATDEMVGGLSVHLQHIGTRAAGPVQFRNLSQTYTELDLLTPRQSTMDAMGAPLTATADRPGTTPLICIADQGTTAAARAAAGVTLVDRYYAVATFLGDTPPPGEVYGQQSHGCLTMACGVPPGGRLLDAHIFDSVGVTLGTLWIAAVRWAVAKGAQIISMSFGGTLTSQAEDDLFRWLADFDVICFISSGNSGTEYLFSPAQYSAKYGHVHSVGASNEATGLRATFSNYAGYMSGLAPGQNVAGLLPSGMRVTWSGTSASAPHVANLAARLMDGGHYTARQVGAALKATRRRTSDPENQQGGGAYDFAAAKAYLAAQEEAAKLAGLRGAERGDVVSGAVVPVATWNALAQRIDDLGVAVDVRRASVVFLAASVEQVLPWQIEGYRTRRGMWRTDTPDRVTTTMAGRYLVVAHVRFGASGGSTVGTRAARLCLNGTTSGATQVHDRVPATASAAGTSVTLRRTVDCRIGDTLQVMVSSSVAVAAGHTDRGGSHLFVTYLGGSGSLPPVVGTGTTTTGLGELGGLVGA